MGTDDICYGVKVRTNLLVLDSLISSYISLHFYATPLELEVIVRVRVRLVRRDIGNGYISVRSSKARLPFFLLVSRVEAASSNKATQQQYGLLRIQERHIADAIGYP